jgi:hypothetical protein
MEIQHSYCSACDQQVRIVVTPGSAYSGQAPVADQPDVVCLDFGERCTGAMCPMIGLPRILMGIRLAQSGLRDEWQTFNAPCQSCGQTVDFEVLDANYAMCPSCHTRHRWLHFKVDNGAFVALADETE